MAHSLTADFYYTGPFIRSVIDGLLEGWGVESTPAVPSVPDTEATQALWKAPLRCVTVVALGEEMVARHKHPPFEAIRNGRFDALVTIGISDTAFIQRLVGLKIPLVLVDFPNEQFSAQADQVYFDPLPGYRHAIQNLIARGARRIHFIGELLRQPSDNYDTYRTNPDRLNPRGAQMNPDSILRLSATRQVLSEMNFPFSDDCIHHAWALRDQTREQAEALAALPDDQRPDAVVSHSAELAHEFIDAFARKGRWLAGAGATSLGFLGSALPIFADGRALGRTAASLTVWKLQAPERPALRVGVPMQFLSTAPTAPAVPADSNETDARNERSSS